MDDPPPKVPAGFGIGGRNIEIVDSQFYEALSSEADNIDKSIGEDISTSSETLSARNRLIAMTFFIVILSHAKVSGSFSLAFLKVEFSELSPKLIALSVMVEVILAAHYIISARGEYISEKMRRDARKDKIIAMRERINNVAGDVQRQVEKASAQADLDPKERLRYEYLKKLESKSSGLEKKLNFLNGLDKFERRYNKFFPWVVVFSMFSIIAFSFFNL